MRESPAQIYFHGRRLITIHSIYHTAYFTIGCLCALRCHSFKKPGSVFLNTGSASERDSPHLHLSVIYHQEVSTLLTKERIQVLFLTQNWASSAAPKIIRSNVRSHLQTSLQHALSVPSACHSLCFPRTAVQLLQEGEVQARHRWASALS